MVMEMLTILIILSGKFYDIVYHKMNIIIHPPIMSTPTFYKLCICSQVKTYFYLGQKKKKGKLTFISITLMHQQMVPNAKVQDHFPLTP